jgi:DNA-binding NtrC family response regulator
MGGGTPLLLWKGYNFRMTLSLFSLPSLGAALALVFLFFFALKKGRRSSGIALLLSIILHSLIYMVCEFLLINTTRRPWALVWDKTIYYAIPVIAANYLHLSFAYLKPCNLLKGRRYLLALIYLPALFLIGLLPTDQLIAGLQPEYWGWGKVEGPFYKYFRIYLMIYIWAAILAIFIRRRHAEPKLRNGMAYLGLAYIGPVIVTTIVTAVLQPMGINAFNIMVHPVSIIYAAGFIAYAIIRQHLLFDMQLLLAPAIKTSKYRFHQQVKALIRQIHGHNLDYGRIVAMLHDALKCAVGLNIDGQPMATCGGDAVFAHAKLTELDQQIEQLHDRENAGTHEVQVLSRATFENFDTLYGHLEASGIEAILPLYHDGRILGTLKFGKGFSDKIYSKQDFQLISALWSQLVVALKYIRKLEEQMAIKDRIITRLNRKIRLLQTDFRSVAGTGQPDPATAVSAVWLSNRRDWMPPLDNCSPCDCLQHALEEKHPDVVITDGRMMSARIQSELNSLKKPLIIIGSARNTPEVSNHRMVDHIPDDQIEERLAPAVQFLGRLQRAVRFQADDIDFITVSRQLLATLTRIEQAAPNAKAILLMGKTGTGKELIAAHIARICKKEMISVNCAAISDDLFESAFFGHEKGAFTSAVRSHRGYLEQTHKGILFLDEISELPMEMQAKLLRILESRAFQRVGGQSFVRPKVQFVFASNRDLHALMEKGEFREDLLYRIDQLSFELPPLCERREDIELLAGYYLMRHKNRYRVDARINAAAMEALKSGAWPGNVRELSNAVLKMVMDAQDKPTGTAIKQKTSLPEMVRSYEAALIQASLKRCTSKNKAAKALGIPVSTLRSKLKKIDLHNAAANLNISSTTQESDNSNLSDKLSQYEISLINKSLKHCSSQSEAARELGIPLSTLRSKAKKHNIDIAPRQ